MWKLHWDTISIPSHINFLTQKRSLVLYVYVHTFSWPRAKKSNKYKSKIPKVKHWKFRSSQPATLQNQDGVTNHIDIVWQKASPPAIAMRPRPQGRYHMEWWLDWAKEQGSFFRLLCEPYSCIYIIYSKFIIVHACVQAQMLASTYDACVRVRGRGLQ